MARTVAQLAARCTCGHTMASHSHRPASDGRVGCIDGISRKRRCACLITGRSRAEIETDATRYVGVESKLAELRAEWRLAA